MQVSIAAVGTRDRREPFVSVLAMHFIILLGAMLLAVQFRLQIAFGKELSPEYDAMPILMYAILLGASLITAALSRSPLASRKPYRALLVDIHPFRRYLVSLGIAWFGLLVMLQDVSQLQLGYFGVAGLVLGILCVALPYRLYIGHPGSSLINPMRMIWERRSLLSIWLLFNIEARYSQRVLGILWIILLPIATSVVLSIAFNQLMGIQLEVPYITYYMSAMVPYTLFSNSILNSTNSIIARITLVAQVYFPREILVLLTLGEGIVDFFFAFAAMLVINLLGGVLPNANYGYLVILFLLLALTALGIMFLVSVLTLLVRDIPQLLFVIMQLLFFLTPIIYPVEQFPERLQFLFVINPISPIIQGFRDVIAYGRVPNLVSLNYSIVFTGVALIVGYATFKSVEGEMADYV